MRSRTNRGPGHTSLAEGARVEYEIEQGPKGPQAGDGHTVAPARSCGRARMNERGHHGYGQLALSAFVGTATRPVSAPDSAAGTGITLPPWVRGSAIRMQRRA